MLWPPSIMRLHLAGPRRRLRLWLPIVLVWPLVLLVGIALAPLVVLLALLLWPAGKGRAVLLLGPWLFYAFCCLRGAHVRVAADPGKPGAGGGVLVAFF